jgi:hypothetical protein
MAKRYGHFRVHLLPHLCSGQPALTRYRISLGRGWHEKMRWRSVAPIALPARAAHHRLHKNQAIYKDDGAGMR